MIEPRACRKGMKYAFAYFGEDVKYCTDRQKIDEFIRGKIGKELIVVYGNTDLMLDLLDVLHGEGAINYSSVFALTKYCQNLQIVYFFIKKTEQVAKVLHVEMEEYDNWEAVIVDKSVGGPEHGCSAMMRVETIYGVSGNDDHLRDLIDDIMACKVTDYCMGNVFCDTHGCT